MSHAFKPYSSSCPHNEVWMNCPTCVRNNTERLLVKELAEALAWCGAAKDFQPGGIAEKGWDKVRDLILKADKRVKALEEEMRRFQ